MRLCEFDSVDQLNRRAADDAAAILRRALTSRGSARIVAATGRSQLGFLECLTAEPAIDWARIELFHLDEYIGLDAAAPASFSRFIRDHLIRPTGIVHHHLIDGSGDPVAVMTSIGRELTRAPLDIAFVGIGENGHLAFNEPPADFETDAPFLIVTLDEITRAQQVAEGWFARIEDVPAHAITMSMRQIMNVDTIICVVHGPRKAEAVHACFSAGIRPSAPASLLMGHPRATVYVDRQASRRLDRDMMAQFTG
jgi:glucosamine-6-phosphate deaminase